MSRPQAIGRELRFEVEGRPVPEGSLKSFRAKTGAIITKHDNDKLLKPWRKAIADAVRAELPDGFVPVHGAVKVEFVFRYARPAFHYLPANSKREKRLLREDAPYWMGGGGDLDKLTRAVLDALTGVVYADDEQVFALGRTRKVWSTDDGLRALVAFMDRVVYVGEVDVETGALRDSTSERIPTKTLE